MCVSRCGQRCQKPPFSGSSRTYIACVCVSRCMWKTSISSKASAHRVGTEGCTHPPDEHAGGMRAMDTAGGQHGWGEIQCIHASVLSFGPAFELHVLHTSCGSKMVQVASGCRIRFTAFPVDLVHTVKYLVRNRANKNRTIELEISLCHLPGQRYLGPRTRMGLKSPFRDEILRARLQCKPG